MSLSMLKKIKKSRKSYTAPSNDSDSSNEQKYIVPLRRNEIPKLEELSKKSKSFRDTSSGDRQALFIHKLNICCIVFDFDPANPKKNMYKDVKRQALLELVDHISTTKRWFSEEVLRQFIRMISINLFRSFPPSANENITDPEDEEPVLDNAWPHLQIIYEFLLRFVVSTSTDTRLMKKYINQHFVIQLIELFKSDDPRERDYLKTILHRIYGKFMSLRQFIRKVVSDVFHEFIYVTGRHAGIGEILEILGSIINGFALPLKQEHQNFLKTVLIPLHKSRMFPLFNQQLSYCVTQFMDKDSNLAVPVITGLLNYWPIVNSGKQVLFLNELEEVLELTPPDQFDKIVEPLFQQIAKAISSKHFQVAERALFLWNNEYISSLTSEQRGRILPILYPALHRNSKLHWNTTVHTLTFNVIRMFMEMDPDLFERCAKKYSDGVKDAEAKAKERQERWNKLAQLNKQ